MAQLSERWQLIGLNLAQTIAKASKDESTKVGCVIFRPNKTISSMGFNGFPPSIEDDGDILTSKSRREEKLAFMVHAEANALDHATESLVGHSLVVTAHPCSACALKIVNKGITNVYYADLSKEFYERWRDEINKAQLIFKKAGVNIHVIAP